MNSYPPELLAQLAPVMFVAGLDLPPPSSTQKQDPFQILTLRLRDALLAQHKVAIWQPAKTKSFQIMLMGKDVRFPPRKLVAPDDPHYASSHSPLSPLTPTSPLYPDGLIAPIWIRKHTTLIPSVFVVFLRIFERPQAARPPLDIPDAEQEKEREFEERERDLELAAEIAQRKKTTAERGIKLTVVLMATRGMLDDPSLDTRLTFIRRQSALDSRASLFVLSPVSPSELNEFVHSLQQALHEPAVEYYTSHSKRVRRKRNRHSQNTTYPTPAAALGGRLNVTRPLRPEGWTVRYEYKMACFAEFRGEDEVALKHFQDAYETLTIMFSSTAILPPRTKRWAEAKVLVDCINVKIVKLYLYNNEHSLALSHHNSHIRQFSDFSRGWGIGEETFEFWSWMARQHRVLAELLEHGLRSNLVLPVHKPLQLNLSASQATVRAAAAAGHLLEYDTARSLGINPSHALHHPGFYYYVAARCTEIRRKRFLVALEAQINQEPMVASPGFANEKKVEHLAVINELYTKAYELFKKYSSMLSEGQGQGRLTLWIAYRIAQTYYDAGKFNMAVRFFERIAKTYRCERWHALLRPLLSTWYACAKQLGDVELSIKLLVEMIPHDFVESEDPSSLEDDLVALLKSTVPSSDQALVVELADALPIFDPDIVFWLPEVKVGDPAPFQLTLTAPTSVTISSIPFTRLTIFFVDDACPPIIVDHEDADSTKNMSYLVRRIDLGRILMNPVEEAVITNANLRWGLGDTVIFAGFVTSERPAKLEISSVVLAIVEHGWKIEIPFEPRRVYSGKATRWLTSVDPPKFITVMREDYHSTEAKNREHLVNVVFHHHAPAYLDEDHPVEIEVTNVDSRELDVVVNFLLQPTEIDDAVNWIVFDGEKSSSLIRSIHLGVLAPGVSTVKTLHMFNTGAGGDRVVDVSIQTKAVIPDDDVGNVDDDADSEEGDDEDVISRDTMEHLSLLVVPTINPVHVSYSISYERDTSSWAGLTDLATFEDSFWDCRRGGHAIVTLTMTCVGPWSLLIENIDLERKDNQYAKVLDCSTDMKDSDFFPAEYVDGDEFCARCRIAYSIDDDCDVAPEPIEGPGQYYVTWHRVLPNGKRGSTTRSYFVLPTFQPPLDNLVALLDVPPRATLHKPILLTLTIRNYHPSRSANITAHLDPDTLEGFVVSGIRSGRVPVLLPGSEEKLVWQMIPLECGYVQVPRIKVIHRRKTVFTMGHAVEVSAGNTEGSIGEAVKVIDLRHDLRQPNLESEPEKIGFQEAKEGPGTILVLP